MVVAQPRCSHCQRASLAFCCPNPDLSSQLYPLTMGTRTQTTHLRITKVAYTKATTTSGPRASSGTFEAYATGFVRAAAHCYDHVRPLKQNERIALHFHRQLQELYSAVRQVGIPTAPTY